MRDERELVGLANENFIASFAKLAEHCEGGEHRWFGGVFAFVTRLPISFFNGCVVVEPVTSSELDDALSWVEARDVPKRLFVTEEFVQPVAPVIARHGLEREAVPYPGMVLHPIPEALAPAHDVVVDEAGLEELRAVFVAFSRDRRLAERLFSASLLADGEVTGFVARLDGRAVGYSLAIRSQRTSGVYNVGTLPESRRKGVGTALTWAAVDVALRAGLDCAVLQSSQMAVSLYEAMGFRTVVRYAVFSEPVTPIGQETPVPPSPQ
jgi:ribosomal protein S18 acetylase RimI-like enzyme